MVKTSVAIAMVRWFAPVNHRLKFLVLLMILTVATHLPGDDGAASIAAGGLVVMKREPRIVMAKEALTISTVKVIVDYDFRNESDIDITTEVAFPIPAYGFEVGNRLPSEQGFEDFKLWVEGKPVPYQVETRAFLKDVDYTQLLVSSHVDIASFGHFSFDEDSPDIKKLPATQRKQLENAGLIGNPDGSARWEVRKKYYWRQTFPAHKTVHIRHEYSPKLGGNNSITYAVGPTPDPASAKELQGFCVNDRLHATLQQIYESKDEDAPYSYVDFILTTANTWKTPIEDFTLIVERPHYKDSIVNYVSFCWDGPVTKIDADHFLAHTTNLVPVRATDRFFQRREA